MANPENDQQHQAVSSKVNLRSLLRWTIILLVAFGLWKTLNSAWMELTEQRLSIRKQLEVIDHKIQSSQDSATLSSLRQERLQLESQDPQVSKVRWLLVALSSCIYAISLICPALFFHQTLVHLGQQPRIGDSISAHLLGHLGKYVPGKAMVVVLRTTAIVGPGVHAGVATLAVFVETLVMMAVGGTVSGVIVTMLEMPVWISAIALGMAICTAIPTLPPLFIRIVKLIAKSKLGSEPTFSAAAINWRLMFSGWAWMVGLWAGIGVSFLLLIAATPGAGTAELDLRDLLLAVAAISLAMVAGFISLIPGGAGIRELVITTLLASRFGLVPALVAAVLARVTFLAVELLIGCGIWILKRR